MIQFVRASSQNLSGTTSAPPPQLGSICFWFIPNDISNPQGIWWEDQRFRIYFSISRGYFYVVLQRRFNKGLANSTPLSLGVRYHVVCTWDASGTGTINSLYLNGVLDGSNSDAKDLYTSAGPIYLGSGSGSGYLSGLLEDVREYNRILTLDEIRTIYLSEGRDDIYGGRIQSWDMLTGGSPGSTVVSEVALVNGGTNLTPSGGPVYREGYLLKKHPIR